MTNEEFSDAFDTVANSYGGQGIMAFDEYEKSLFLT